MNCEKPTAKLTSNSYFEGTFSEPPGAEELLSGQERARIKPTKLYIADASLVSNILLRHAYPSFIHRTLRRISSETRIDRASDYSNPLYKLLDKFFDHQVYPVAPLSAGSLHFCEWPVEVFILPRTDMPRTEEIYLGSYVTRDPGFQGPGQDAPDIDVPVHRTAQGTLHLFDLDFYLRRS